MAVVGEGHGPAYYARPFALIALDSEAIPDSDTRRALVELVPIVVRAVVRPTGRVVAPAG